MKYHEMPEKLKLLAAETRFPSPINKDASKLNDDEKIASIEKNFEQILETLGLDLNDDSLQRTPHRLAKMYVKEIFKGLKMDNYPDVSFIDYKGESDMVFSSAKFNSFCEHHFVPMNGSAYVAYIPKGKLIGLSKIPRVIKYFAQRPQMQERLTAQIADSLSTILETEDIAVSLTAEHHCVVARGVENCEGLTTTNQLKGRFQSDSDLRRDFFEAINRAL